MRSFSNILPNFATNLHLLVDSIGRLYTHVKLQLFGEMFGGMENSLYLYGVVT